MDDNDGQESNATGRVQTIRQWLSGANFYIYCSHFLASWSSRMWAFSMSVFLVSISPESLELTATYGLVMGAAVLLLATVVGDWVDRTPRLRAAIVSMVLVNIFIIACAGVVFTLLLLMSNDVPLSTHLLHFLYGVIITLSVSSRLMKVARVIVVERDWTIEMCSRDEQHLAVMTSSFRRIDLVTKMIAPPLMGQVLTYASKRAGCIFIACWCLASIGAEYWLTKSVYNKVPALRAKKSLPKVSDDDYSAHVTPTTDISKQKVSNTLEPGDEKTRKTSVVNRILQSFLALYRGFRIYISYDVMWAGLALAALYLTVLGFDGITVGYATTQGLSESVLGIMMGVGAGFGILATFTYPFIVRRLGLPKTGILALGLQVSCLSLCVLSVWLPGSPFDLAPAQPSLVGWNESQTLNCSTVMPNLETSTYDYNDKLTTAATATSLQPETSNIDTACEAGTNKTTPVWIMIIGIVLARFGLWTADLTIIQLFLERVKVSERGIVNGFQSSLNQMMNFLKYAFVIILPRPNQFGYLVFTSFFFICLGWSFMGLYAFKVSRCDKPTESNSTCHYKAGAREDYELNTTKTTGV